jgi:hypothetical protein
MARNVTRVRWIVSMQASKDAQTRNKRHLFRYPVYCALLLTTRKLFMSTLCWLAIALAAVVQVSIITDRSVVSDYFNPVNAHSYQRDSKRQVEYRWCPSYWGFQCPASIYSLVVHHQDLTYHLPGAPSFLLQMIPMITSQLNLANLNGKGWRKSQYFFFVV